jgi:RNA polymerase sigma-70 factor (ECF subfamily)
MDTAEDIALHLRLIAGDPTATLDSIERWLPHLVRLLGMRFAQVAAEDEHIITTAAIDALLSYTANPQQYNPERGTLSYYLYMLAYGDLLNALRSRSKRSKAEIPIPVAESSALIEDNDIANEVASSLDAQTTLERIRSILTGPEDHLILSLMLAGERSTAVYAQALGISHLPESEQRAIVKRHKDRISRRLERLGDILDE